MNLTGDLFADLDDTAVLDRPPGQLTPVLSEYERFLVLFSGGKDSIALFLWLLDQGVPKERIELHHHLVDGAAGESDLMDWPITTDYCKKFADAFGVKLSFSWREGGFEREMLRNGTPTAPVHFYSQSGQLMTIGGKGEPGTRLKFPQLGASLSTRWCSAYLKIDVGVAYLVNTPLYREGKTLVLTGERAEESAQRAKYAAFEPHRTDNRNGARVVRWIDQYRAVHSWAESQVWDIIKKYGVNPHPAYQLGLGRTSCMACIFGSPMQWAMLRHYMKRQFDAIAAYEKAFGVTIKRDGTVEDYANRGVVPVLDEAMLRIALGQDFSLPIILPASEWKLPAGAFGESCGPT